MTYEDFVFALRDYDNGKIFQRKFFDDLNLPDELDEKILADTKANSADTLETLQSKIAAAEKLQYKISDYQNHISRHIRRLEKYLHAIEKKSLVDSNANLDVLRERYTKGLTLLFLYTDSTWTHGYPDSDKITVYYSKESVMKNLKSLYVEISDNVKELYKAERNYYRCIFAERLKAARKAAGLTQTALSEKTGIARRNISDYEKMLYEPNLGNLVKFSEELGKPVGWFLGKQ